MNILNHPNITVLNKNLNDFYSILKMSNIPINKNQSEIRTVIDWHNSRYPTFNFFYDFMDNEKVIQERLFNTIIYNKNYSLVLELGPNRPLLQVEAQVFANNWNAFLIESGFGITAITIDGKYFFEFAEEYDKNLYSNFQV